MSSSSRATRSRATFVILALREILWACFYALLSIGMTWPLARHLSRAVSDPGDPFLNAWILHWDWLVRESAALVAGIFFAFVPCRFEHLSHLQHVWSGSIPLTLAALVLLRRPSAAVAILFVVGGRMHTGLRCFWSSWDFSVRSV